MKHKYYLVIIALFLYSIGTDAQEAKTNDSARVNQYGQEVKWQRLHGEAQEGILKFTSDDKSYSIWLDNRVLFDAGIFSDDALNKLGNGAKIRRARFAIKSILWDKWYAELDLDFAGSQLELKDAYIMHMFDSRNLNIKAGHFREGFGLETNTTSRYVNFIERSLASKLDPSRHLGVQAIHWRDKYVVSGGVHFNSVGDLEEAEISKDANKDNGQDEGYSLTGRAVYRPIIDNEKVVHLGVAGSYRTPKTTAEIPNSY
jgi:phosphate-selective porin OprO/OprP